LQQCHSTAYVQKCICWPGSTGKLIAFPRLPNCTGEGKEGARGMGRRKGIGGGTRGAGGHRPPNFQLTGALLL